MRLGSAWQAGQGTASRCMAGPVSAGQERLGMAALGEVGHGRLGSSRCGGARHGMTRQAGQKEARVVSTLLELIGLTALIAGVLILAGLGWALVAACPVLLFVGSVTDDTAISRELKRAAGAPMRLARRKRGRRVKAA